MFEFIPTALSILVGVVTSILVTVTIYKQLVKRLNKERYEIEHSLEVVDARIQMLARQLESDFKTSDFFKATNIKAFNIYDAPIVINSSGTIDILKSKVETTDLTPAAAHRGRNDNTTPNVINQIRYEQSAREFESNKFVKLKREKNV